MGASDRGSQWRNRLLRTKEWSGGRFLFLGKGKGGEGGDDLRLASEESAQVKGPDACFP